MRRTNLSLIYVAAYLLGGGIILSIAPRVALQLCSALATTGRSCLGSQGFFLLGSASLSSRSSAIGSWLSTRVHSPSDWFSV